MKLINPAALFFAAWFALAIVASAQESPSTQPTSTQPTSPQPTSITLHAKYMDAREVIAQIAKQADIEIQCNPPWLWNGTNGSAPCAVSVDMDHVPFWTAMAEFCAAAHGRVFENGNQGLMLSEDGSKDPGKLGGVLFMSGPYAVVATRIQRNAQMELATGRTSHFDSLQLSIYIDPNIHVQNYSQPWFDVAVDDNGKSMIPDNQPALENLQLSGFGYQRFTFNQPVNLKFPPIVGRRLSTVKGGMFVEVPDEISTLTIDDCSKSIGKTTTVGDFSMQITSCHFQPNGGNIEFVASRKSPAAAAPDQPVAQMIQKIFTGPKRPPQMDWMSNRVQGNAIQLIDADGNKINSGGGGGGGSDARVQWSMSFSQSKPIKQPVKLVWQIAIKTRTDTIHFEFTDLPLPQE